MIITIHYSVRLETGYPAFVRYCLAYRKYHRNFKHFQGVFKYLKMSSKAMSVDHSLRDVQLSKMYGSESFWGSPEFPLVRPGFNHTVLYHIPNHGDMETQPKPQIGSDKWDQDHVRLPCSRNSLYPVVDNNGKKHLKERWQIIEEALSKPIRNSKELAEAIFTYNTKFKDEWTFTSLHYLLNEHLEEEESAYFFDVTLPQIAQLALSLPKLIKSSIPLLRQENNRSVSLTQQQISSLLANAFFCTFPRRNSRKATAEFSNYPYINFSQLYNMMPKAHILEKLKCICHYFRRVCTKVPTGVVTFTRRYVPLKECPKWSKSDRSIASIPFYVDGDSIIEDMNGLIQVDFANKFLGGGVLSGGCVQEEIRFVICPELMLTMLFTEVLRPTETVMIIGCERFSDYTGYGSSFQWAGNHEDQTPLDSSCRRRCAVLAMDAMPFRTPGIEWRKEAIVRELNKSWVGFSTFTHESDAIQYPGVATGNWGCGAFGGTAVLKSLLQILSGCETRRPVAYCTFKDEDLVSWLREAWDLLAKHDVRVGQLFNLLLKFCETSKTKEVKKNNKMLLKFLEKELRQARRPQAMLEDTSKEQIAVVQKQEHSQENITLNEELSPDMFTDDEVLVTESKPKSLFTEMDKLDEASGNLNLTEPKSSQEAMDVEVSPKVKKVMTKKITDYFSKKS